LFVLEEDTVMMFTQDAIPFTGSTAFDGKQWAAYCRAPQFLAHNCRKSVFMNAGVYRNGKRS
jgi:hypothetical protein